MWVGWKFRSSASSSDHAVPDLMDCLADRDRHKRAIGKYPPMSKRQLIDDIRKYNTTAQIPFLAQFDEASLAQYLEHLQAAERKHIRIAGWVRKQPKLKLVS